MELCRRKTDSQLKFRSIIYLGVDEAIYNRTKDLASAENYHRFSFLCEVGGFILLILTLISAMPKLNQYLGEYQDIFAAFGMMFLFLVVIFRFYVRKHRKMLLPMCYVASALLLTLAILIGPVMDSETLSTTFFILLFVIALLMVDLPMRIGVFFVLAGVAFCIVVGLNKSGIMRVYDFINCGVFVPAGTIIMAMVEKRKFMQFELQRQIEGERDTDGLTTLLTRDAGQRDIEKMLENGTVEQASLIVMDLDDFKQVNDTYGHPAGDVILSAVGDILKQSFRDTDVLVRFGGDEYVLLLRDISNDEEVKVCMKKIRERLASINMISGYQQTASFGVAFFPEHGKTFAELFNRADKALYAAKWRGKNNSCIYHEKKKSNYR